MAFKAHVACPNHEGIYAEVKFMLPTADGRWAFFASCPGCAAQGRNPTTYLILDLDEGDMDEFMANTRLSPWLVDMLVKIE